MYKIILMYIVAIDEFIIIIIIATKLNHFPYNYIKDMSLMAAQSGMPVTTSAAGCKIEEVYIAI